MSAHTISRRTVVKGAAALASSTLLPAATTGFALAQAGAAPVALRAAAGSLPEIAGQGSIALFNDSLPGPLVRVKKGGEVALALENALGEGFALVWHGVRATAGIVAPQEVAAGGKADIRFTPLDAGTYWYHAAAPALSRRALAGPLVVDEANPAYASDNVLFIQAFPPQSGVPLFPVNGAISPTFTGPGGGRTRLRLINATPIFLRLRIQAPAVYVIAVDGRPAEPFAPKDSRVQIAPGGRVDLAATLDNADPAVISIETSGDPLQLAIVNPVGAATSIAEGAPPALPGTALPAQLPFSDAARFTIDLGQNGKAPALGPVKLGRVVQLTLNNPLDVPLAVRIDGHPVRLLDPVYDGWSAWWHDTVPVSAKGVARIAFKADSAGTWPIVATRGGDGAIVAARSYTVTA